MFLTVLRRELKAFFLLPQSYAIAAAYLIISGVFFANILVSTQTPELDVYFANVANTLLVLAPVVAMRSFAEERRSGVLDVSLSWPLSRTAVVFGKFTANTLFIWSVATITWVYIRVLASFTNVEVGKAASGYIGLLLLAAAFSALALAVSAYTSSPTAAAFLGFGLLLSSGSSSSPRGSSPTASPRSGPRRTSNPSGRASSTARTFSTSSRWWPSAWGWPSTP